MTTRSLRTTNLTILIATALGVGACDRALPIGTLPGEFHPHDPHGSGGAFGTGGIAGSGGASSSGGSCGAASTTEPGAVHAVEVAPGWYHVCARMSDGSVRCWGDNQTGELGTDAAAPCSKSIVAGVSNVAEILADYVYSCAVAGDGIARCWGSNTYGQFGNGATSQRSMVVPAFGGAAVKQLSLGEYQACALYDDGHVACAGITGDDPSGNGAVIQHHTPDVVPGLSGVLQVEVGANHACALLADHTVSCWGRAGIVDPCASSTAPPVGPTAVGVSNAIKISAAGAHACALLADQTVTCWGRNSHGELGTPAPASQGCGTADHRPIVIPSLTGVRDVSAGDSHTCALMNEGTARCWGDNQYGQLGDGSMVDHQTPAAVAGLTGVTQLAAGYMDTCAILSDGTLTCWGAINPFFSSEMNLTPTPIAF